MKIGQKHPQPQWLVILLFLLFFFLALDSLTGDSPTMDEQNHIARGITFLKTADPRLSLEHPPLVNGISALLLLTLPDVHLPLDHTSWQMQPPDVYWYIFAEQFLWVYNHDVTRMVFLARLPIVFLTMFLGLVGYQAARQMWGKDSAPLALGLMLFDPNLLAHGRYATTDLGGTLFVFLATWLLWRLWKRPSRTRWLWLVGGIGLAFASKLSTLVFVPIWLVLALLPQPFQKNNLTAILRRGWLLTTAVFVSFFVVWVIFAFEWRNFRFQSPLLNSLNNWQGPMPTFWAGIEQIFFISGGGRPGFLWGQFSNEGFWNYFPVAFAVKTPLFVLGMVGISAVLLLKNRPTRPQTLFLLLPPLLYLLLSMQSALNIGYRHLLPILPFLYLTVAGLNVLPINIRLPATVPSSPVFRSIISRLLTTAVLLALVWADSRIHPHYLGFFNVIAGGPENGYNILIDSNIDWGQDLLRLKQWMAENGVNEVKLGWFGTADPDYYHIRYQPLPGLGMGKFYALWGAPPFNPQAPEPGVYAISVSSLWELPLPTEQKYVYPWFRARPPTDRVGYSILIYRVP